MELPRVGHDGGGMAEGGGGAALATYQEDLCTRHVTSLTHGVSIITSPS